MANNIKSIDKKKETSIKTINNHLTELPCLKLYKQKSVAGYETEVVNLEASGYNVKECFKGMNKLLKDIKKV